MFIEVLLDSLTYSNLSRLQRKKKKEWLNPKEGTNSTNLHRQRAVGGR